MSLSIYSTNFFESQLCAKGCTGSYEYKNTYKTDIHTYNLMGKTNTQTNKKITRETMIRVSKERTLCQEFSLSPVDNWGMNQAKRTSPSRKKNTGKGSWRARENSVQKAPKGPGWTMLGLAYPRTTSPLSKGRPLLKVLHRESTAPPSWLQYRS